MRTALILLSLTALSACSGSEKRAMFTCPNGPDLIVTYTDDSATLLFDNDRSEVLTMTGEEIYAKPGVVWQSTGFRSARLTDGPSSYACDQASL